MKQALGKTYLIKQLLHNLILYNYNYNFIDDPCKYNINIIDPKSVDFKYLLDPSHNYTSPAIPPINTNNSINTNGINISPTQFYYTFNDNSTFVLDRADIENNYAKECLSALSKVMDIRYNLMKEHYFASWNEYVISISAHTPHITSTSMFNPCEKDSKYNSTHLQNISQYVDKSYYNENSCVFNRLLKTTDYIVLIVDELADLIYFDKSYHDYLVRLATLGRASRYPFNSWNATS